MPFKKLWTKFFTKNDESDEIALHVSGATVRHRNPFESLEVPRNTEELSQDILDKWVVPFYITRLWKPEDGTIESFSYAARTIETGTVLKLLGDFNWRTRISGAYFAAINNLQEFEEIIGKHLLKSEVAYAGSGYCIALASFGTDSAKNYLKTYLEYYLGRKDLYFDQAEAFCALEFIDKALAEQLQSKYDSFVSDKHYWNLTKSRELFAEKMNTMKQIQKATRN